MYKRKKRRAHKGKKKLSVPNSPSPTPTGTTTGWTDDNKIARDAETNDIMSVTTMEVAENHHQASQQQQPQRQSSVKVSTTNSKAVGARKRKPMQISKIVEKLPAIADHPLDFGAEKNLVHSNNNNNSPPYKKPCLDMSKNGIIKNILSELKTAKMGGSRGEALDMSKRIGTDDDDGDEEEEYDNDDKSEGDTGLCIKEDVENEDEYADEEEDEEEEEEEGIDMSGNEAAKFFSRSNKQRQNLYMNPSLKQRYGADGVDNTSPKAHRGGPKTDLGDIKSILSNTGLNSRDGLPASPNGWDRNKYGDDDDSANDEGADLRSITGNSTGDDELPFRCGVCAYGSCDKSTLLRHMRTHSGERPFQCRLCYFAFTTKANCERHLRNRHGQIDRDQLRNLVVCLPTSSNASESETEATSNGGSSGGGAAVQQSNSNASVESNRKRGETPTLEENEMPLDLSMDAVDLSTKHRDGNPIFRRRASIPRPRPLYATTEMPNALVTSPFVSKREPMVHPQLPLNTFSPQSIPKSGPIIGGHPTHPAFSLFPFGGPPPFNPFAIPQANVEKLISLGSSSPPRMPNPFMATASSNNSFESREAVTVPEKEVKVKSEPQVQETKRGGSQTKSTSSSSASPTTTGRKKGDSANGEYQKPKQRRYRTERPFACPHCPARFTLRSNMERHGKHQHPTVWQRSPSNRVINRQKNQQLSPLVGPPTLVHPNKYTSSIGADVKDKSRDAGVNVRAVIAQQLKRKLSNSSLRNNNNGSETETDPENTPSHDVKSSSGGDTSSDLASVSQLLDRVKSSNFAQYFNEAESQNLSNDNNNTDDEGEGDESAEENLSSEEGDTKVVGAEKKKSAYSSAPHKISCPHCTRRFPWTSSLRRHLLTHTGQKPFQCSKCPLLFTTKSNCDRHLARKHSGTNNSNKGASDSNNSSEDEDGEGEEDNEDEQNDSIPAVSTTASNGGDGEETANAATAFETPNSNNNSSNNGRNNNSSNTQSTPNKTPNNGSTSSSPAEDAAFRCHLCEAAAGEREALLTHMEEQHKETFHLLVSKGALSSSPPSENSETEQNPPTDQRDVTHRKVMCVFCIRRFWSVEDLRRHIRSHSGERPFSCPHCSRRFTLKHSMLRHLKKHSSSATPSRKLAKSSNKVDATNDSAPGRAASATGAGGKTGDLIGRLLGLNDDHLVEKLLSQPDANDAAKLLGLGQQQQQLQNSTRVTSKVN